MAKQLKYINRATGKEHFGSAADIKAIKANKHLRDLYSFEAEVVEPSEPKVTPIKEVKS